MPALLSDAYGAVIAQQMQIVKFDPKKQNTQISPSSLGAVAASSEGTTIETLKEPVIHTRQPRRQKDGNYEIHITIDRQDCHLLCLFIGVFTLSVIFNANKRKPSVSS